MDKNILQESLGLNESQKLDLEKDIENMSRAELETELMLRRKAALSVVI